MGKGTDPNESGKDSGTKESYVFPEDYDKSKSTGKGANSNMGYRAGIKTNGNDSSSDDDSGGGHDSHGNSEDCGWTDIADDDD